MSSNEYFLKITHNADFHNKHTLTSMNTCMQILPYEHLRKTENSANLEIPEVTDGVSL
jgi:hypothetical protein